MTHLRKSAQLGLVKCTLAGRLFQTMIDSSQQDSLTMKVMVLPCPSGDVVTFLLSEKPITAEIHKMCLCQNWDTLAKKADV